MARSIKKGIEYFSHDVNMMQDRKLKVIKAKHGLLGYAVYNRLLEEIYSEGYYIDMNEKYKLLFCDESRMNLEVFEVILNDCMEEDLFDIGLYEKYGIITSSRIQSNYCAATERRKEVNFIDEYLLINVHDKYNQRKNQSTKIIIEKINVSINEVNANINEENVSMMSTSCQHDANINDENAYIGTQSKVKESKVNNIKEYSRNSDEFDDAHTEDNDVENSFEKYWALYPNKAGKGSIKPACKIKVHSLGEEFKRCIERYIKDTAEKRKDFPELSYKNGSTFFNSGYVDYLDENYVPFVAAPKEKTRGKPTFNTANERQYDYEAIERMEIERRMSNYRGGSDG